MSDSNDFDFLPKILREHQTLTILRTMVHPAFNRSATDGMLYQCLERMGQYCSRGAVRALLDHMEQIGLLNTRKVEDCVVATLTEKGERVALGKDRCEGVAVYYPE